ncbi:MAG: hypothetical protein LBU83_11975 [Bacteroidales bacterium]|jgi:hypothetical protein|nr:hypothetical protein [Bacteroidales bacterium]
MKSILKNSLLMAAIFGLTFSPAFSQMRPVFSVSNNNLPEEVVALLLTETTNSEITALTLTKNNRDKDIYLVTFSPAEDTRIIILNEQTGNHVMITSENTSLTEFQLATYFIEELKLGTLGDAERFLVVETSGYSVKNVSSVSTSNGEVFIPRYFYGEKENMQEAFPKDRFITTIYKSKPRLTFANPDDPEVQQRMAKMEEERSYYVYMLKLPDGTRCTYDENFNPE